MEIIQTIKECHKHWNTYNDWENKNKEKYAKKKYLFEAYKKNNPIEIKKLKEKSDIVLRAVNILDNASENAAQNMQVAVKSVAALAIAPIVLASEGLFLWAILKGIKNISKTNRKLHYSFYLAPFAFAIPAIVDMAFTMWGTKKQIEASRVARAKAREEELKDIRTFVTYTPEQIKQAKEKAQLIDNKEIKDEDKQNISTVAAFKTTLNIDKEYNKYLEKYYKNLGIDKDIEKKLTENYTDKELLEAIKDKELILNEIKEINNNAEKYCENAEAAIGTLQLFNFLMIAPLAFITNKVLNLFIETSSAQSGIIKKTLSAMIPVFLTLPLAIYYNSKTKEAAKVGRYKMKQKFNDDLSKVVYFDENELKNVNVTYKKEDSNIFKRTKNNFKFIPKYLQERKEYLSYKQNQWFEEEKFYKALKTIPITEQQKKEAEKIQKKVFFVFDELDEMSQKYSENMEGFIGLANSALKYTRLIALVALFLAPVPFLISGNFRITTIGKKISDFIFDKNSQLKKNIDEIYNIAQKDKNIKLKIDRALSLNAYHELDLLNEPKIAKPLKNIINNLTQLTINKTKQQEFYNKELKHGVIANYLKNLTADILKVAGKKLQNMSPDKINAIEIPQIKELILNFKNIKIDTSNLRTLKLTALALILPAFVGIASVSYLINSLFAHLQKKAGYIGVMKSINKLDKTKYFAIKENEKEEKNSAPKSFNKKYFSAFCR